jgi:hypothetical protein
MQDLTGDDIASAGAMSHLEHLAETEYGVKLIDLILQDEPVTDSLHEPMEVRHTRDALWRLGRLVGITVKEPFTNGPGEPSADSQTGARHSWNLSSEGLSAASTDTWQYQLISRFLDSEQDMDTFDWLPPRYLPEHEQVQQFLFEAQNERGVFAALATSTRKYLCKNEQAHAALQAAVVDEASQEADVADPAGSDANKLTGRVSVDPVDKLSNVFTAQSAAIIVSAVPWLDETMLPFVAGLLVIITAQGLNGFCSRSLPAPVPQVIET